MELGISSYSFHRLGKGPEGHGAIPPVEAMIDRTAALGLTGFEVLGVHMPSTERDYLNGLKRHALHAGVHFLSVSAHHDFVKPDPESRREQVRIVDRWIEVAAMMGAPVVRVFGGRWRTIPDFSEYMARRGHEPPVPGYTEDDAWEWIFDCFGQCLKTAEREGVTLALENHWGFTASAAGTCRIIETLDSPWMRAMIDTGNFLEGDVYAEIEAMAPHAVLVQAKAYPGGGLYYTLDLDYPRIIEIFRRHGYRGALSLEMEGNAHPDEGVPEALAMLRAALAH